jgi:hypothetical protein
LALAFFFGDEFGSLAALSVDAVTAILFAGLLSPRHHCPSVGFRPGKRRWDRQLTGGPAEYGEHARPVRFGGVYVSGRGSENDCAIGHLLICPPNEAGVERLDQMMDATVMLEI